MAMTVSRMLGRTESNVSTRQLYPGIKSIGRRTSAVRRDTRRWSDVGCFDEVKSVGTHQQRLCRRHQS
jgi:hypothetical protein